MQAVSGEELLAPSPQPDDLRPWHYSFANFSRERMQGVRRAVWGMLHPASLPRGRHGPRSAGYGAGRGCTVDMA
jgi:hypothetical protein